MIQLPLQAALVVLGLSAGLWAWFYRRQRSLLPGKSGLVATLFMLALCSATISAREGADEISELVFFASSFFVSSLVGSGFRPRQVILFLASAVGGMRRFTAAEKYLMKLTWPHALGTAAVFAVLQIVFASL